MSTKTHDIAIDKLNSGQFFLLIGKPGTKYYEHQIVLTDVDLSNLLAATRKALDVPSEAHQTTINAKLARIADIINNET